jgi:hypothetical protein
LSIWVNGSKKEAMYLPGIGAGIEALRDSSVKKKCIVNENNICM